jgi:hypothetical protein
MGLLDRIKQAVNVDPPDPNPVIVGTPARGHIVDTGRYSVGNTNTTSARWSKKEVTLYVVGGPVDRLTTVSCFLGERAHVWATWDREIPILLDPAGNVLGVDVPTWEAEVAELDRTGAPLREAAPATDLDARAWEQEPGALDSVEGVDFDTWVTVEAALATEAVSPADWDSRASQLGVPAGRWVAVQHEWQSRLRKDWKLASRFGAAYAAATGQ